MTNTGTTPGTTRSTATSTSGRLIRKAVALVIGVATIIGALSAIAAVPAQAETRKIGANAGYDEVSHLMTTAIGDLYDYWVQYIPETNADYLWLHPGRSVNTSCGNIDASVGPFYCPSDDLIIIPLDWAADFNAGHGSAGLLTVVSNMYAFNVQAEIGYEGQDTVLSAQCLTGAFVGEIDAMGLVSETAVDQILDATIAWGDTPDRQDQLIDALVLGYDDGPGVCVGR